jgi:hypothetical protein
MERVDVGRALHRAGMASGAVLLFMSLLLFPVVARAALSGPIGVDAGNGLHGIACASAQQCTAIDNNHHEVSFNPTAAQGASPIVIEQGSVLRGVACPSASQCTIVDNYGRELTFDPASPETTTPTEIDGESALRSVACPSVSQCTAIDYNGREVTFNPTSPGSPTSSAVDTAEPASIACPSAGQCTAVDNSGHEVTFNPASPGGATPAAIGVGTFLRGVACPSVSQCTAVDYGGHALTFNPAAPSSRTITPIDTGALESLACPSLTQCTAVDLRGQEVTFNPASPETAVPVIGSPFIATAGHGGQASQSASHASLSGVAKGKAKLSFALAAGKNARLKTVTIALPNGLAFSSSQKNLANGILVKAGAKLLKFAAKVAHGRLTITLKTSVSSAQFTLSSPAIAVSKTLAKQVKGKKVKTLSVLVTATDTHHTTTRTTLKLKPT